MTEIVEPKLEVGDFVRNKIHGYISFLYGTRDPKLENFFPILFFGVCVDSVSIYVDTAPSDYMKEGFVRFELPSELKKVPANPRLIAKAKEYLLLFHTDKELDNLSYIECLNKLTEQEKELKNENEL